ncbi:hypothetical protein PVAP13_5NG393302 [Panicum virgatum]|uniref:Uncharacterized protein n=1 Tax=Panicum virgatum TaxID=38727 RepID=A0A8T0RYJ8_PANVG|nr:hypothetical protein PVAP13_5NG393302 [Panicum virgatum]
MELAAVRIDNSRVPEDPSPALVETLEAAPDSMLVGAAAVDRGQSEENYVTSAPELMRSGPHPALEAEAEATTESAVISAPLSASTAPPPLDVAVERVGFNLLILAATEFADNGGATLICGSPLRPSPAVATPAPVISSGAAVELVTRDERDALGDVALELEEVTTRIGPAIPAITRDEPNPCTIATPMFRVLPDNLIIYSHTRQTWDPPPSPDAVAEFIDRITKKVDALVPVPAVNKRRKKTAGPVNMPRRSRRIAKLPPEFDRISTTTVCRKLGFTDDDGKISDEALERYLSFYRDHPSRDHIAALSALFGWVVPSEDELVRDLSTGFVC